MRIVNIPDPCPMKLAAMSPAEGGNFCSSCNKVVVDFRNKTDEEIISILMSRVDEQTCGSFRAGQVAPLSKVRFSVVRFAASVLLAFGAFLFTGCGDDADVVGKVCVDPDSLTQIENAMKRKADSTAVADSVAAAKNQSYLDSARSADAVDAANQ